MRASAPDVLVLLPRTSREEIFFFGKISLSGSAAAQDIADPCFQHRAVQIHGQVATSAPPLHQGAPVALAQGPNPWWPLSAPYRGMLLPIPGEFSLVCGLQPHFSPSVFHNCLPSHRIPAGWAGFILFALLFLHLLLMFLFRVTARGMRPQSPPLLLPLLLLLPACCSVFCGSAGRFLPGSIVGAGGMAPCGIWDSGADFLLLSLQH